MATAKRRWHRQYQSASARRPGGQCVGQNGQSFAQTDALTIKPIAMQHASGCCASPGIKARPCREELRCGFCPGEKKLLRKRRQTGLTALDLQAANRRLFGDTVKPEGKPLRRLGPMRVRIANPVARLPMKIDSSAEQIRLLADLNFGVVSSSCLLRDRCNEVAGAVSCKSERNRNDAAASLAPRTRLWRRRRRVESFA